MRAGQFRPIEDDGQASLKIPLNKIPTVSGARHPTFEDIDMQTRTLIEKLSVSSQLALPDLTAAADQGIRSIINNRPDGEASDQPTSAEIEAAAAALGLGYRYIPVVPGQIHDEDIANFNAALAELEAPVLAFCRTGTRSASLWALSAAADIASSDLLSTARAAGYDLNALKPRLETRRQVVATHSSGRPRAVAQRHDVVIVGGGAAGLATAASLLRRRPGLDIAVIEPADRHFYQPGWTLVGCGVFNANATMRPMASIMPKGVRWQRIAVEAFEPEHDRIVLADGTRLAYRVLVAAPGLKLNWGAIPGLEEALGKNGVTSNYRFDLAPYTWELVQKLGRGTALFTQPPMPIKCAGAPQKAMYLSCDHWRRADRIGEIDVEFHVAGDVLFGVKEYVPALMHYIERYGIDLKFESRLVAVNGPTREATFAMRGPDGGIQEVTRRFDLLHVCPPQTAPDFVRSSPLAGDAGWIDVDDQTLRHTRYENVFSLGDVCSAPNAKTMAAARKQAPIVAENGLAVLDSRKRRATYDGYGACPLTVERGRVVLAEFGYGGKLLPTFPKWVIDGTRPSRLAWLLKLRILPLVYWQGMLKGREWLAAPQVILTSSDTPELV
jgi:sulfide:quinone oxidoreductase